MSKKLQKRVNEGLAIYFGIGSLICTILLFVALLVQAYKAIFLENNTSWDAFLFITILMIASGGMAYALIRIGYEEIEN